MIMSYALLLKTPYTHENKRPATFFQYIIPEKEKVSESRFLPSDFSYMDTTMLVYASLRKANQD